MNLGSQGGSNYSLVTKAFRQITGSESNDPWNQLSVYMDQIDK